MKFFNKETKCSKVESGQVSKKETYKKYNDLLILIQQNKKQTRNVVFI